MKVVYFDTVLVNYFIYQFYFYSFDLYYLFIHNPLVFIKASLELLF